MFSTEIVCPPNFNIADSKDNRVRVLGSKNKQPKIFPVMLGFNAGGLASKEAAVSRMNSIISLETPSEETNDCPDKGLRFNDMALCEKYL